MTQDEVTIKIGEHGEQWLKRYPGRGKSHQPAPGATVYSVDWDVRPRGNVKVDHGSHSIPIPFALGVSSMQVVEQAGEGAYEFSVYAGITDPDLIAHEEARDKLYAILKAIEQKGWKSLISEDDPRITGKDRLNYVLTVTNTIGLDTQYIPTLEEWMKIRNLTSWSFYADRQYLSVDFQRERTLLDPSKSGSYLLTYTLKSEVENYRGYVGPDNRARWKELLPTALLDLKQRRAKAEAALKAQGIKIDESYQDPPLPNLK